MIVLKVGTYVNVVGDERWGRVVAVDLGRLARYRVGGGNIGEPPLVFDRAQLTVITPTKEQQMQIHPLARHGTRLTFPVPAYAPGAAYVGTESFLPTRTENTIHPASIEVNSRELNCQPILQEKIMDLVKQATQPVKSNAVVYTIPGLRGTVRVSKRLLDGPAPEQLTLEGASFATPKPAKVKLTREERAAARAAAPKLTEEQKIAKAKDALAKREARLATMATA